MASASVFDSMAFPSTFQDVECPGVKKWTDEVKEFLAVGREHRVETPENREVPFQPTDG